jgi:hypothetical protein
MLRRVSWCAESGSLSEIKFKNSKQKKMYMFKIPTEKKYIQREENEAFAVVLKL